MLKLRQPLGPSLCAAVLVWAAIAPLSAASEFKKTHELLGPEFLLTDKEAQRLAERAEDLMFAGDFVQALDALEKAKSATESAKENRDRDLLNLSTAISKIRLDLDGADQAALGLEQALARSGAGTSPRSGVEVQAVLSLAIIRTLQGRLDEADALVTEAVPVVQKLYGTNHFAYATALQAVGVVKTMRADYKEGYDALERSAAILERCLGSDDPRYALGLSLLALALVQQTELSKAEALCQRSIKIIEKVSKSPVLLWLPLDTLTVVCDRQAKYDEALLVARRNVENMERCPGQYRLLLAEAYMRIGVVRHRLSDLRGAAECLQKCLAVRESVFGTQHFFVAHGMAMLALVRKDQGFYGESKALLTRSLSIYQRTFRENHTLVAEALVGLARLSVDQGQYAQAMPLLRRSLAIMEKAHGPNHVYVATCLTGLANVCELQGDYATAASMYARSLEINEKRRGPDHPATAECLEAFADFRKARGEYREALGLLARCLEIRLKAFGNKHPAVADTVEDIGLVFLEMGDYTNALASLQGGLAIKEAALGKDHPDLGLSLARLGFAWHRLGRFDKSLELNQRSLELAEASYGGQHPDVITVRDAVAADKLALGKYAEGLATYSENLRARRSYLATQLLAVPAKDAIQMAREAISLGERFESHCAQADGNSIGTAAVAGAEYLALSKAFLEELEATQAALEADPATATEESREAESLLRFQLARLAETKLDPAERTARRTQIYDKLEAAQAKLAERSGLVAQAVREKNLKLADLAHALSQAVLVDFVQYRRFDFTAKTNSWKEQRYAAYLTFPLARDATNVVVERVDLGEAAPINAAVEAVCKRMSAGQFAAKDVLAALQRLSRLVYAPLAPHLTNVSHLIICPDGQLSRLPFEMLPVGNKFLVEEKTISYVTSGREIVRIASPKSKVQSPKSAERRSMSLVMGDPDFDFQLPGRSRGDEAPTDKSEIRNRKSEIEVSLLTSAATRSLSRSYTGIKFLPLPGSGVEATNVAKLLGEQAVLRLGPEAREAELKAVVSPRVLHLATHGFFLSDQEFKRTNALRDSWPANMGTRWNASLPKEDWENPLVRCGIALAGANHAKSPIGRAGNPLPAASSPATNGAHGVTRPTLETQEDGLLTGLEAALLNLQGTELVILSACDSGTGEVKIGEGVMSLRRAFRIAGAETVLASHWPVSDKATSRLMTDFMHQWRAGEPRAKAWREAQLSLLRSKDFSNPYFWAAFTLTGQWN